MLHSKNILTAVALIKLCHLIALVGNHNKIRQRTQPNRIRKNTQNYTVNTNYSANFLNTLNQYEMLNSSNMKYSQHLNQETNDENLFSFEELKNLTFKLISNLRKCNYRELQFEVVTSLAYKFLYP